MVSSSETLVNKEEISKFAMKTLSVLRFKVRESLRKEKVSVIIKSLEEIGCRTETRYFDRL